MQLNVPSVRLELVSFYYKLNHSKAKAFLVLNLFFLPLIFLKPTTTDVLV